MARPARPARALRAVTPTSDDELVVVPAITDADTTDPSDATTTPARPRVMWQADRMAADRVDRRVSLPPHPQQGRGVDTAAPAPPAAAAGTAAPTAAPAAVPRKPGPLAIGRSNDDFKPFDFAKPFCRFLSNNPTVFHAVDKVASQLQRNGYTKLWARDAWKLERGGKYFVERNGSSLIAFAVGSDYEAGNGFAMIAGHVDALTAKVKPMPTLDNKEGYVQLGVAPYAGGLGNTWWDRDLGIAGRVLVKDGKGKIVSKLVNLSEPIAKIPTLAPHFGAAAVGPFNQETQMVPIIGMDNSDLLGAGADGRAEREMVGDVGTFASTQPARLVKAIAGELNIQDYNSIVNWELELYDVQPARVTGLDKEFISGGRIDDKLCSWAAIQALLSSAPAEADASASSSGGSSIVKMVGLFDDEEIGSLLRQGAHGNLMPSTVERVVDCFAADTPAGANLVAATYANSFLVSADVSHAVNPNFLGAYLKNHAPRLNVGVAVSADPNGHMTTDAVSTAFFQRCAELCKSRLQVFQIRNDSRSGGTVGPMLSSAMGCRAIDAGIVQLSMHSIRATTGSLDPGLGVQMFKGFFDHFETVDAEFRP